MDKKIFERVTLFLQFTNVLSPEVAAAPPLAAVLA